MIGGQGDSTSDGDWLQSYGIDTLAVALERKAGGLPPDPVKTERMRSEGLADPDNFFENILEGGGTLRCMANVQRGQSVTSPEELGRIACPVMCLTGDQDFTGGDNAKLASYIPRGEVVYIEGHDHGSAVATLEFSVKLLSFLGEHMPPAVGARL